jgi:hypothetical protein
MSFPAQGLLKNNRSLGISNFPAKRIPFQY